MVDEQRMSPGLWLGLVLCVLFAAFILMFGWQERRPSGGQPERELAEPGSPGKFGR